MLNCVRYSFSLSSASQNFVDVCVTMPVSKSIVQVHLPAWRPGRYELGNFSRNIRGIRAENGDKTNLQIRKIKRNSWEISGINGDQVTIFYQYYANELNAGSTYTDGSFLYVNPVNCSLYSTENNQLSCEVTLHIPNTWQVAGVHYDNGKFKSENFDKLADSPFIASPDLESKNYSIGTSEFSICFHRQLNIPWEKLLLDFTKFSKKLINDFGEFPTKRFEFIIISLPYSAYHGVEHLESTIITLGPSYDMFGTLYSELLGVSCHELYHVWNIKTIRPVEMLPYDFSRENYSQLGFIYEGITTYFGDLFLLKSDVFTVSQYLKELCQQFQKHADNFGRRNYSLADTSIDTWVDGYVPGIPDRKISIYTEGCLLAFWLDIMIITKSNHKKNLQSLMTLLFHKYAKKNNGIDLQTFCNCVDEISGSNLSETILKFIYNPTDFIQELIPVLNQLGLELTAKADAYSENFLGIKSILSNGNHLISSVHPEGTAVKNDLRIGDEILAINGIKIKGDLNKWLQYFGKNKIKLSIHRNGTLLTIKISEFSSIGFEQLSLTRNTQISEEQSNLFSTWIGAPKENLLF